MGFARPPYGGNTEGVYCMKTWKQLSLAGLLAITAIIALSLGLLACDGNGDNGNNPTTYTVTFDADNGTAQTTQIVEEGGRAERPSPDPVNEGLFFGNWFNTADDAVWNFDTVITQDITLKARWDEWPLGSVARITLRDIVIPSLVQPQSPNLGSLHNAFSTALMSLAGPVTDMKHNVDRFNSYLNNPAVFDLPSADWVEKVSGFALGAVRFGRSEIEDMFEHIADNYVSEENRELFTAYIDAFRGMNYIGVRKDNGADYTTNFDLGSGVTTVGDMLQRINDLTGENNYTAEGTHPRADIRAAAVALMGMDNETNGSVYNEKRLADGVIGMIGNLEQLIGLVQHVRHDYVNGPQATPSQEASNTLNAALGEGGISIQNMNILNAIPEIHLQ